MTRADTLGVGLHLLLPLLLLGAAAAAAAAAAPYTNLCVLFTDDATLETGFGRVAAGGVTDRLMLPEMPSYTVGVGAGVDARGVFYVAADSAGEPPVYEIDFALRNATFARFSPPPGFPSSDGAFFVDNFDIDRVRGGQLMAAFVAEDGRSWAAIADVDTRANRTTLRTNLTGGDYTSGAFEWKSGCTAASAGLYWLVGVPADLTHNISAVAFATDGSRGAEMARLVVEAPGLLHFDVFAIAVSARLPPPGLLALTTQGLLAAAFSAPGNSTVSWSTVLSYPAGRSPLELGLMLLDDSLERPLAFIGLGGGAQPSVYAVDILAASVAAVYDLPGVDPNDFAFCS